MSRSVEFSGPRQIPYPGGCVLEPGRYALEYLLKWATEIRIGDRVYPDEPVFAFLQRLRAAPEEFGVTPQAAQQAVTRYLELAGQALVAEGGDAAWLAKEFAH